MAIGNLNSNSQRDKWDRWWNHSDVVSELSALGLESAYHRYFGEAQGQETQATFYLQRNLAKKYHIDYAFLGSVWREHDVQIGSPKYWLELSDHMPLTFAIRNIGAHPNA